jgi:predicted secreted hydrolase
LSVRSAVVGAAALLLLGGIAGVAWMLWPSGVGEPQDGVAAVASAALAALAPDVPAPPVDARELDFPRDHGPHPDHRTEVWDLNGRLTDSEGRHYGLRLTFLRIALVERDRRRASSLAADALMLGRFALLPAEGEPLRPARRVSRIAITLAGAGADPARVWLETWSLRRRGDGSWVLTADRNGQRLELTLTPEKAVVTDRQAGLFDAPGDREGPGFRFYLQPRLSARGRLTPLAGGEADAIELNGSAWLERTWGPVPGALAGQSGQLALNRFAMQLDDGSELFCLHLRRRRGGGTPIPSCLHVGRDSATRLFRRAELMLEHTDDRWVSPNTGAGYPLDWRLEVPALRLDLRLTAVTVQQELDIGQHLWSGAINLTGSGGDGKIAGSGRMDLSGYGP